MSSSFPNYRLWSDIIEEEEQRDEAYVLALSWDEWTFERVRRIREWRGKDILARIAALDRLERLRLSHGAASAQPAVVPRQPSEFDEEFSLWKEMIENPSKFGDDITDWLALDAKLSQGPGRWRLGAYWHQLQEEEDKKEEALSVPWRKLYSQIVPEAAYAGQRAWIRRDIARITGRIRRSVVRIQSAVRGHLVRSRFWFGDCCMCLAHRICPLLTDVGFMCRECARQGPYVDETGPLEDGWNWSRADYTDLARRND